MPPALALLAQVNMHHTRPLIIGALRLGRHLRRGHRNMVLFGVSQHTIQGACNNHFIRLSHLVFSLIAPFRGFIPGADSVILHQVAIRDENTRRAP